MRSATPKHLHPILGRRMVDWVARSRAAARARPARRDRLPTEPGRVRRHARRGAGAAARHRRRSPGRAGSRRRRREPPRPVRGHAASDLGVAARARRHAPPRAGGRDRAVVRAGGSALVRTRPARRRRHRRGDRRGRRRDARAAGRPGVQLLDLPLSQRAPLAGARPPRAAQRPGRALPDRRRARPRRPRRAGRRPRRRRSRRDRGRQHPCRACSGGRLAPLQDQRGAHARRRARSWTQCRPGSNRMSSSSPTP